MQAQVKIWSYLDHWLFARSRSFCAVVAAMCVELSPPLLQNMSQNCVISFFYSFWWPQSKLWKLAGFCSQVPLPCSKHTTSINFIHMFPGPPNGKDWSQIWFDRPLVPFAVIVLRCACSTRPVARIFLHGHRDLLFCWTGNKCFCRGDEFSAYFGWSRSFQSITDIFLF